MIRRLNIGAGVQILLKKCAVVLIILFVLESILCNTVIIYLIWNLRAMLAAIVSAPGATWIDKLLRNPVFSDLIATGKEGGFAKILEQTVGRLFIEFHKDDLPENMDATSIQPYSTEFHTLNIGTIELDVSSAGEVLYILHRLRKWQGSKLKWQKLVVDIGANDGLMSSNSYNFIRWGWSAILVEPQSYQLDLAKRNLKGFLHQHPDQHVYFLNAVLSDYDGRAKFQLSPDVVGMESHVVTGDDYVGSVSIDVTCYSVKSFAQKYSVPKHFGILSIDAEGLGSKILHQWIKLQYRPLFIIYESLHDPEDMFTTSRELEKAGYTFLTTRGWNHIYEYIPST